MPRVTRNKWICLRARGGIGGPVELVAEFSDAAEMGRFVDGIIDEDPPHYAADDTLYAFGPVQKLNAS